MSSVREFNPGPNETLTIGSRRFIVKPHPAVPTFAFGQEGRKAFVFQVSGPDGELYALKKFKQAYRVPELKDVCDELAQFAAMPGLEVCRRECLVFGEHDDTLSVYPDLEYAVLMPWITGFTWYDIIVSQKVLRREHAVLFANSTAQVLRDLEEAGLAHCDIAGPTVIINDSLGSAHLIDIEDLYAPGFYQPAAVPAGTEGYAHRTASEGLWRPSADRFAGAVMIAEMLAWHSPEIRKASDEEHYFGADEMQQDSGRYRLLHDTLASFGTDIASLFEQAWFSETLEDCPALFMWYEQINEVFQTEQRSKVILGWTPLTGSLSEPSGAQADRPSSEPIHAPEMIEQTRQAARDRDTGDQPVPAKPAPLEPARPQSSADSRPIAPPASTPGTGGPVAEWRPIVVPMPPPSPGNGVIPANRPIYSPPANLDSSAETRVTERPIDTVSDESAATQIHSTLGEAASEDVADDEADPTEFYPGLLKPVLDLQRIDNNRPHLVWSESQEATRYLLQEDDNPSFTHPKEYKVKGRAETRWNPPLFWRRSGKLFYRVRAINREGVGPWSDTLSLRIGAAK